METLYIYFRLCTTTHLKKDYVHISVNLHFLPPAHPINTYKTYFFKFYVCFGACTIEGSSRA